MADIPVEYLVKSLLVETAVPPQSVFTAAATAVTVNAVVEVASAIHFIIHSLAKGVGEVTDHATD